MDKLTPDNILFRVIDSVNIGLIAVVFTPKHVWELTDSIAILHNYSTIQTIIDKLDLIEIEPSVYEHQGLLGMDELRAAVALEGFIENPLFSAFVDVTYSHDNFPMTMLDI